MQLDDRDRFLAARALALTAKHLDLCPTEPVDGLLLVADGQQRRLGPAQHPEDRLLQRVGVLKLVDQQLAEALLQRGAHIGMLLEQDADLELQVLVVDSARFALGPRVFLGVPVDQHLQRLGDLGRQQIACHQFGLADQLLVLGIAELELLEVR